jgi:hypothetical protein
MMRCQSELNSFSIGSQKLLIKVDLSALLPDIDAITPGSLRRKWRSGDHFD